MTAITQEGSHPVLPNSYHRCIYYKSQRSLNPSDLELKVSGQVKSCECDNLRRRDTIPYMHPVGMRAGASGVFFCEF